LHELLFIKYNRSSGIWINESLYLLIVYFIGCIHTHQINIWLYKHQICSRYCRENQNTNSTFDRNIYILNNFEKGYVELQNFTRTTLESMSSVNSGYHVHSIFSEISSQKLPALQQWEYFCVLFVRNSWKSLTFLFLDIERFSITASCSSEANERNQENEEIYLGERVRDKKNDNSAIYWGDHVLLVITIGNKHVINR